MIDHRIDERYKYSLHEIPLSEPEILYKVEECPTIRDLLSRISLSYEEQSYLLRYWRLIRRPHPAILRNKIALKITPCRTANRLCDYSWFLFSNRWIWDDLYEHYYLKNAKLTYDESDSEQH